MPVCRPVCVCGARARARVCVGGLRGLTTRVVLGGQCAVHGVCQAYARAAAFQIKCSLRRTANTAPQGGGVLASRLDSLNVLIPCGSGACAVGARGVFVGSGRGEAEAGRGSAHRSRWRAWLSSGSRAQLSSDLP